MPPPSCRSPTHLKRLLLCIRPVNHTPFSSPCQATENRTMASGRLNTRLLSHRRTLPLRNSITWRLLNLPTRSTLRKIRILQALLSLSTRTYILRLRPIPLILLLRLTSLANNLQIHIRMSRTLNFIPHSPSRPRTLSSDGQSHSGSLRAMLPYTTLGYTIHTANHHSTSHRGDKRRRSSRQMGDLSR